MKRIITQFNKSSLISFAIVTLVGFIITPSANAGFIDWISPKNEGVTLKKSFNFALSYIVPEKTEEKVEVEVAKQSESKVARTGV